MMTFVMVVNVCGQVAGLNVYVNTGGWEEVV